MRIKLYDVYDQMSDLLLDFIPDDLILNIMTYADCEEFFQLLSLYEHLKDKSLLMAQKKVGLRTGLRTNSFDLEKLKQLSKFRYTKNICCGYAAFIISYRGLFRVEPNFNYESNYKYLKSETDDCLLKQLNFDNVSQIFDFGYNNLPTLYVSGNNLYSYKEEIRHELDNVHSLSVNAFFGLMLKYDGTVYGIGESSCLLGSDDDPILIQGLNDIIHVSAGQDHSLALTSNGQVYELGNSDKVFPHIPYLLPINNIVQIAAGDIYSLVLDSNGDVYLFGSHGAECLGHKIYSNIPILIKSNIVSISTKYQHSLLLDDEGYVYSLGNNEYGQLGLGDTIDRTVSTLIPELNNIVQISTGENYSFTVDNNGDVYIFGYYMDDICYYKPTLLYRVWK